MNQHAVKLGRLGGKKGGLARAASLTQEKRSEIARQGARERWGTEYRLAKLRSDRLFRRRVAKRLSQGTGLDVGDIEHALYNLTLTPMERLARCLARSR
jgi:hypothetical protein